MVQRFSASPTRSQRAQQIWLILIGLAHRRQTMTYGQLAGIVGFKGSGVLGSFLAPVMFYCSRQALPPLTVLIVNQESGLPGVGLQVSPAELHAARERVFAYDWYDVIPPSPEDFETAMRESHSSEG